MIYKETIQFDDGLVRSFADITGDTNPIHLDEKYAENTIFKRKIVHGMFLGAIFSKIIGTKLPGNGTIYLSQEIKFLAPIYLHIKYIVKVEVLEVIKDKSRIMLSTLVTNEEGKNCVEGIAVVKNKDWVENLYSKNAE